MFATSILGARTRSLPDGYNVISNSPSKVWQNFDLNEHENPEFSILSTIVSIETIGGCSGTIVNAVSPLHTSIIAPSNVSPHFFLLGGPCGGPAIGGPCGGPAIGGPCGGPAIGGPCGGPAIGGPCGGPAIGGPCGGPAVGGPSE